MRDRVRVAILVSGAGTTMQSLVEAMRAPEYPAQAVVVIADRDCPALGLAGELGVPADLIDFKLLGRAAFETELRLLLAAYAPDWVCLAGFMRVLGPALVTRWPMLNIHPSLLPDFKGVDVHARVLAAGCMTSGCTVHHVVPELDAGPIVMQASVPVYPDDTPASLQARVQAAERVLYPAALRAVIESPHQD